MSAAVAPQTTPATGFQQAAPAPTSAMLSTEQPGTPVQTTQPNVAGNVATVAPSSQPAAQQPPIEWISAQLARPADQPGCFVVLYDPAWLDATGQQVILLALPYVEGKPYRLVRLTITDTPEGPEGHGKLFTWGKTNDVNPNRRPTDPEYEWRNTDILDSARFTFTATPLPRPNLPTGQLAEQPTDSAPRYTADDRRRALHLVELRSGGVHWARIRPGQYDEVYTTLCGRPARQSRPAWSFVQKPVLSCERCKRAAEKLGTEPDKTATES